MPASVGCGPNANLVFRVPEVLFCSSTWHLGSGLISAGAAYGDRMCFLRPGTASLGVERGLWASVGGKLFSRLPGAARAPASSLLGPPMSEEGTS